MKKCIGPDNWRHLFELGKIADRDALEQLSTDSFPEQPGWYIIVVTDDEDAAFWALYCGQAEDLQHRNTDHKKFVRLSTENSLLYFTWRGSGPLPDNGQPGRRATFVLLGTDKSGLEGNDQSLFLNITEMFIALMSQSLQRMDLAGWLPEDVVLRTSHVGLNVALPLHQNHPKDAARSFSFLSKASSSTALAYRKYRTRHAFDQASKRMRELDFMPTKVSNRQSGHLFPIYFRNADPSLGDVLAVPVRCRTCGGRTVDDFPYFLKRTGAYVARRFACDSCPKKSGGGRGQREFLPLDPALKMMRRQDFNNAKDKSAYLP